MTLRIGPFRFRAGRFQRAPRRKYRAVTGPRAWTAPKLRVQAMLVRVAIKQHADRDHRARIRWTTLADVNTRSTKAQNVTWRNPAGATPAAGTGETARAFPRVTSIDAAENPTTNPVASHAGTCIDPGPKVPRSFPQPAMLCPHGARSLFTLSPMPVSMPFGKARRMPVRRDPQGRWNQQNTTAPRPAPTGSATPAQTTAASAQGAPPRSTR